jgi:hypothetical protein
MRPWIEVPDVNAPSTMTRHYFLGTESGAKDKGGL